MFKKILEKYEIAIKEIIIDYNLIAIFSKIIRKFYLESSDILIVTDQNIYPLIENLLPKNLNILILEYPKPNEEFIAKIITKSFDKKSIIGFGSGTINDLCKISSYRQNIPYIIFPSAVSMNGYASKNASIITSGRKNSVLAHLPMAIYMDLDLLINSPKRMIKAGIGDSICISTCRFDWLLSHLLLDTKYNEKAFDLVDNLYQELLDYNGKINDKQFIILLSRILIYSGLSMTIADGSYPASQSEHLIAHYLEIKYPQIMEKSLHGEQIAISTLTIAKLQEKLLKLDNLQINKSNIDINYLYKIFDQDLAKHFWQEFNKKIINSDRQNKINKKLINFKKIKIKLNQKFVTYKKIKEIVIRFDLAHNLNEIGLNEKQYNESIKNSYFIRNRFTILDIFFNM